MNTFDPLDPHKDQPILFSGAPADEADAAIIMVHGRGATADSILQLADELPKNKKFVLAAPQAYGNTWYPNSFISPRETNEPKLTSALKFIGDVTGVLFLRGIPYEKLILLGFSQGACLVMEYAAQNIKRYGGIIVLSGGLIGESLDEELYKGDFSGTPVFMGCSDKDPHIPLKRVNESEAIYEKLGAKVTKKIYPNMGHTINNDEIKYISTIMQRV